MSRLVSQFRFYFSVPFINFTETLVSSQGRHEDIYRRETGLKFDWRRWRRSPNCCRYCYWRMICRWWPTDREIIKSKRSLERACDTLSRRSESYLEPSRRKWGIKDNPTNAIGKLCTCVWVKSLFSRARIYSISWSSFRLSGFECRCLCKCPVSQR